jgi:hypothetical protein
MGIGLGERKGALIIRARALDYKARSLAQNREDWANGFKELKREIVSPSILFSVFFAHRPNRANVYVELPF